MVAFRCYRWSRCFGCSAVDVLHCWLQRSSRFPHVLPPCPLSARAVVRKQAKWVEAEVPWAVVTELAAEVSQPAVGEEMSLPAVGVKILVADQVVEVEA